MQLTTLLHWENDCPENKTHATIHRTTCLGRTIPYLEVQINGYDVLSMIDSGASTSIMSEEIAIKLSLTQKIKGVKMNLTFRLISITRTGIFRRIFRTKPTRQVKELSSQK
eukprot:GHVP01017089.1.p1 GENE.GHVP01017089.1~~GHVP01017089.1.p1  ORF type:complete len:111 (-),score=5.21 GHVP01017089.1:46-378(-)